MSNQKEIEKNRLLNIVWTVSENYQFMPELFLLENIRQGDKKENLDYQSILMGGIGKYLDYEQIYDFWRQLKSQVNDDLLFRQITALGIEEYCIHHLIKERFGISHIREKTVSEVVQSYYYNRPKTLTEDIRKSYYEKKNGKLPATNAKVYCLIERIEQIRFVSDTKEFILYLTKLFQEFFHFEFSLIESSSKEETKKKRNYAPTPLRNFEPSLSGNELAEDWSEVYTSAEFSAHVSGMDDDLASEVSKNNDAYLIREELHNKIRQKVEALYGQSIYSPGEILRMEKTFATGIHAGHRLHITKGNFREENQDDYRMAQIEKQEQETTAIFENNAVIYKRNISRLKDVFLQTLAIHGSSSYQKSDNGKLNISSVWRVAALEDSAVFFKDQKDDYGSFVVDILLDSSGSQTERQSAVSIQGYLLSQALSMCHIPHRVSSFNNFMDFCIIKIFRDYDESATKNKEIFRYHASGSNRDGLAIRVISDALEKRTEKNKILIILSDGRPNDVRITKQAFTSIVSKEYKGKTAIEDTALEIRKVRMKKIAVLGVFTGEEEDLEAEKLIYGKDFAYIRQTENFSEIVGLYLKRQIANMLEDY